jgi:hypothetical protein
VVWVTGGPIQAPLEHPYDPTWRNCLLVQIFTKVSWVENNVSIFPHPSPRSVTKLGDLCTDKTTMQGTVHPRQLQVREVQGERGRGWSRITGFTSTNYEDTDCQDWCASHTRATTPLPGSENAFLSSLCVWGGVCVHGPSYTHRAHAHSHKPAHTHTHTHTHTQLTLTLLPLHPNRRNYLQFEEGRGEGADKTRSRKQSEKEVSICRIIFLLHALLKNYMT